tara:strand:- start:573 stop:1661 length:1089 start_codon:yes stop_codon:yes gene_type:complete
MGVCTYKGGTLPAHSKAMCTQFKGTWTEGDAEEPGLNLIGKDFSSAIGETWNQYTKGEDDTAKENLGGYVKRRWNEDPASLAFDAALMYGGVGAGRYVLSKLGMGKLFKNLVGKTKTTTKTVKPVIDPKTKRIKKGSTYGEVTSNVWRPRIMPSALIAGGAYQADKHGMLPFVPGGAFSQEGKDAQYQKRLETLQNTVAGLDKKANTAEQKANAERIAKEEAKVAQDKIDNMSFFDKWKLGMKDPRTAALFGAGLRDIGSNIPGQNQLGAMQVDLADADAAMAAANKPNAALHNVTKVSNKELMTRFTDDPTFIIGSDTKEARKATYMLGMYRSLEAQLLKAGLPADDVTIMRLLEEDSKRA